MMYVIYLVRSDKQGKMKAEIPIVGGTDLKKLQELLNDDEFYSQFYSPDSPLDYMHIQTVH